MFCIPENSHTRILACSLPQFPPATREKGSSLISHMQVWSAVRSSRPFPGVEVASATPLLSPVSAFYFFLEAITEGLQKLPGQPVGDSRGRSR